MHRWLALGLGLVGACSESTVETPTLRVGEVLGGGNPEGYAQAIEPRAFEFPRDHGPHPEFRSEWWYVTGNLEDDARRRYGFQLTFFRNAMAPDEPTDRRSAWATRQVFMAHFAFTDVEAERFVAHERFARGAVGLAGARLQPLEVWTGDWSLSSADTDAPWVLDVRADDVALRLELDPEKPVVLQGNAGLSVKGPEPGNASYYYSLTRLDARGTLTRDDGATAVRGLAWLDREWSTSALSPGLVGWDWFALQLDDGRDLMLYHLRQADGGAAPHSSGTLVEADGRARTLAADDFRIEVLDEWTSPDTGTRYPSRWLVELDEPRLSLEVRPVLREQELRVSVRYWEGAVDLQGRGSDVSGRGYVELTGYGDEPRAHVR